MNCRKWMATAALGLSIGLGTSVMAVLPQPANAYQGYDYGNLRGLVDRTQNDLQDALNLEQGSKQHDRYRDAQKALSTFDRHLAKGHYDKGELDGCIDRIKSILDHNTLQASNRDALMHDIDDLRLARERHDH